MSIAIKRNFTLPSTSAIGATELYLSSSVASTTIGTGALQVAGGAGVSGVISLGGELKLFNGSFYTGFDSAATANTTYIWPATSPSTGTSVLSSDAAGNLSWILMSASGSGLTLNGLTATTQYFSTSISGNGFTIGSIGSTHTYYIGLAGNASTGLISSSSQTLFGLKTFASGVAITSGIASTNTTTGDLVVSGGVGIGGSINIGGVSRFTSATASASSSTGGVVFSGGLGVGLTSYFGSSLFVQGSTASGSTTTGALVVTGGVGIGGSLQVFGTIDVADNIEVLAQKEIRFFNSGNTFYTGFKSGASSANVTFTLPIADGTSNQALITNGSVGLGWTTFLTSAITSLNGLTAATQTFATGTSGSDFNISSSTSTHTFNIPDASASNRGLVTTGTQSFAGSKTFSNDVTVTGNLTVNGTTTTVNSTVSTLVDPVFTLGTATGGTNPGTDDNKDRGIEFKYFSGTAKTGFFGFDDSTGFFTFIPDAANSSEVFSGTTGVIDATRITGTAAAWTNPITFSLGGDLSGSVSFSGTGNTTLTATIAANSVALGTDTTGQYASTIAISGSGITATAAAGDDGTAYTIYSSAVSTNTASSIVLRDASGNFSAGTLTANLTGTATSAQVISTVTDTSSNLYFLGSRSSTGFAGTQVYVDTSVYAVGATLFATTFTGALQGNAATATTASFADQLTTPRTISLGGDLSGSVVFSGAGNTTLTATIAANSVALGTDTTGQYAETITISGSGITATSAVASDGTGYVIYSSAVSTNTSSAIVLRDGSGNFSAGTITASLTGTASTSTNTTTTALSGTMYLTGTLISGAASGGTALQVGSGLSFVSSTSTLSATTFSGALSGTASSSALVNTDATTGTRYLLGTALNIASGSTQVSVGSGITIGNNFLTSGGIAVTNSTASSSTTSGALIITGGVGIGGSLWTSTTNFSSISGVGHLNSVITSGVWSGTAISAVNGGTGIASYTTGDILYATSSTTLGKIAAGTAGSILTSAGAGSTPYWAVATVGAATGLTLNGLTASTQFFATSISGSGFTIGSTGSTHTYYIALAGNASTGLISGTAQTIFGLKTFASGVAITSGTASTNTTTGALTVAGGVGITGQFSVNTIALGTTAVSITPSMIFTGTAGTVITMSVLSDTTLAWEGSSGQLFSIDNNLSTGEIFSVSDISGLPLISASAGQSIYLNEFGGFTQVGNGLASTNTTTGALRVIGGVGITGSLYLGSPLLIPSGGTGLTTYTTGDILYASSSTTLARITAGTAGSVLTSAGAGSTPYWALTASIGLTTLNTLTSATQYFATSISGSGFTIGSTGSTHTYYIALAGNASTGLISGTAQTIFGLKTFGSGVAITSGTASTNTSTGDLVVSGGVGIGGSLFTQTLTVGSGITGLFIQKMVGANYVAMYSTNVTPSGTNYTFITDGQSPNFNGTNGVYFNISNSNKVQITNTNVNITPTTGSASTSTGSLTVAGGVGIGGSLWTATTNFSSISGVGFSNSVITSGVWSGTAISTVNGGTGLTSYSVGDILHASSSTTLGKIAAGTAGSILTSAGTGATPYWAAATGSTLAIAGTNNGDIQYKSGAALGASSSFNFDSATSEFKLTGFPIDAVSGGSANVKLLGGSVAWNGNINGTMLAINTANTYIGDLFNAQIGGTSRFKVSYTGAISIGNSYTLPITDGTANQVLKTDGAGSVSWANSVISSAQYNIGYYASAGTALTGSSTFANNTSTGVVSIGHATASTGFSTGALVVTGGVGIGQTLFIGGNLYQNTNAITAFDTGFRNRIINGDGNIDQRSNGSTTTPGAGELKFIDRWKMNVFGSGRLTIGKNYGAISSPDGFVSYIGMKTTTTSTPGVNDYNFLSQVIEGVNTIDLQWGTANAKPITLSFWAYSSLTGTFGGSIRNYGTYNRSYPFTYTISSSNTWEKKTVVISGDTTGTWTTSHLFGIEIIFTIANGTGYQATPSQWNTGNYTGPSGSSVNLIGTLNATLYLTGIQAEIGSVATPYERRNYGHEFALCQRYYQIVEVRTGGYHTTGNYLRGSAFLNTAARPISSPVITVLSTDESSNLGTLNVDNSSFRGDSFRYLVQVTTTGDAFGQWKVGCDTEF